MRELLLRIRERKKKKRYFFSTDSHLRPSIYSLCVYHMDLFFCQNFFERAYPTVTKSQMENQMNISRERKMKEKEKTSFLLCLPECKCIA